MEILVLVIGLLFIWGTWTYLLILVYDKDEYAVIFMVYPGAAVATLLSLFWAVFIFHR